MTIKKMMGKIMTNNSKSTADEAVFFGQGTGLYVHIPFCVKKCAYCDFLSFEPKRTDEYLDALGREMSKTAPKKINTVFIGGGTPGILSAEQLRRLILMCHDNFEIADGCEFSVEVNPGVVTEEKIKVLSAGGVNRISAGVQSFNDNELKALGRIHTAAEAYDTVKLINKCGIADINADIMLSIPYQTENSLAKTIDTLFELPLTHISAYSLIIEENTPIAAAYRKKIYTYPDDETDRNLYRRAVKRFAEKGFERYEISNFAQAGHECRHNLRYWRMGEYIGVGLGAHSFAGGRRYSNTTDFEKYIAADFDTDINNIRNIYETPTEKDLIAEFMITGLRTSRGISENDFYIRFGKRPADVFGASLDKFINGGFMRRENARYFLTDKGIDVSNTILCEFV